MANPKTRAEALSWLERSLGGGVVVLEITCDHLDDAFDDAGRWLSGRKSIIRRAAVNSVSGIQEYDVPEDCDEVTQVWFPGTQLDIVAAVAPYAFIDFDMIPVTSGMIGGVPAGNFYSALEQVMAHADTGRRIIGSEPAWEFHRDTRKLILYPQRRREGTVVMEYIVTEISDGDFARLSSRDRDLMLRYAKASLKEILGRVRGKYPDGMPSAGGTKQLDGASLLDESRAEKEALNTEILETNMGVPFVVG